MISYFFTKIEVKGFNEIYPIITAGSFLEGKIPENLNQVFNLADENTFIPTL